MKRMRDGLLRIFARCAGWSAEDVKANVADLLGMTVQEVQAEIDIDTAGDGMFAVVVISGDPSC